MKGNTLSLKWKFTGLTKTLKVYEANLYFNVTTAITEALICKWNTTSGTPLVTSVGRKIFSTRALVVYKSGTYNFILTKLQYSDTGKYFLQVNVGPNSTFIIAFRKSIMKISKIKGEYLFFIFFFFIASIRSSHEQLKRNLPAIVEFLLACLFLRSFFG